MRRDTPSPSEVRAQQAKDLITNCPRPLLDENAVMFTAFVKRAISDSVVGFHLVRVYHTLKNETTNERRLQLIKVLRSWVKNTDESSSISGASSVCVNQTMMDEVKALCDCILTELKNDKLSQRIEGLQHAIETCVVKMVENMAKEMAENNQATDTHFKLIQESISTLESALCTAIAESETSVMKNIDLTRGELKEHTQQCVNGLKSAIAESKEHTQQCATDLERAIAKSETNSGHRFDNLQTAIDAKHTQDIEIATELSMVGTIGVVAMWTLPVVAAPVVVIGSFVGLVGVLKRNR